MLRMSKTFNDGSEKPTNGGNLLILLVEGGAKYSTFLGMKILMSFFVINFPFKAHGVLMFVWQNEYNDLSCQLADLRISPFLCFCIT
jgi:hypothetical protein